MSSSSVNTYIGYSEIVEYFNQQHHKSFWGFLLHHREVLITHSISFSVPSCWRDLNNFWAYQFLKEAEKLIPTSFNILEKKVRFFLFNEEKVTSSGLVSTQKNYQV